MYTHVVEHKAFTYLGIQKHGEQQGIFLGTLLILIYIYIFFLQAGILKTYVQC